jgi:LacI family transcriptional regulator
VKSFIGRQKLDGVILLPPISEDPALARMLKEMNCRYIRVLAVPLDEPSNIVLAMDREAARQVAEHLAKLGHGRIALIAGPSSYRSAHERLSGFSDALADHGVALPQEYVVEGAYTFESGFAAAESLLSRFPRPTAIFACNDEMAAGVYKAAYLKGLQIPKDLTVVGYDDAPLASRIWPSLTTVRLPIRDMGKIAAERLIAKIQHPDGPAAPASTVHPHLVVRDSSSRPAS